jgi:hypothetical protein
MSSLNQSLGELKTLVSQCETELASLHAGKKAAAPRVRASLQKIKNLSHAMRSGVMEFTKELPTKSRAKKEKTEETPPSSPVVLERETAEEKEPETPKKKTRAAKKTIKDMPE